MSLYNKNELNKKFLITINLISAQTQKKYTVCMHIYIMDIQSYLLNMCFYLFIYLFIFLLLLFSKGFVFMMVPLLMMLTKFKLSHKKCDNLNFVRLFQHLFGRKNHAKFHPLSQNLDFFFMQITFVRTPKIMIICETLFTGPHQNLF